MRLLLMLLAAGLTATVTKADADAKADPVAHPDPDHKGARLLLVHEVEPVALEEVLPVHEAVVEEAVVQEAAADEVVILERRMGKQYGPQRALPRVQQLVPQPSLPRVRPVQQNALGRNPEELVEGKQTKIS